MSELQERHYEKAMELVRGARQMASTNAGAIGLLASATGLAIAWECAEFPNDLQALGTLLDAAKESMTEGACRVWSARGNKALN